MSEEILVENEQAAAEEETLVMTEGETQVVAEEETKASVCAKCGQTLSEGQKFCPHCGNACEENGPVFCGKCGKEIPAGSEFCAYCGTKKGAASPMVNPLAKMDKKRLITVAGIVAAVLVLIIILSVAFRKVPVESITVDKSSVEIVEQESQNVSCTVYPDNAKFDGVNWTSSDTKVATVDAFGRITAVAKGECTITVTAGDKKTDIKVVVKKKLPDLKAIYDEFCKSTWAELGSDHSYISVDTNPYDKDDGDYRYLIVANDAIEGINKKLGLPDSLYDDMCKTTWSMGKQEEVYENVGIRVNWTYHTDKGLEVSYKLLTQ